MATLIQELPEPSSYDANASWILIEHDSTLYKIKSSVLLDTFSVQSEYIDSIHKNLSFQDSSLTFSRQNLLSDQSSFILNLNFGNQYQFPSATIIKNSGESKCSLLTFEGLFEFNINSTSNVINFSVHTSEAGNQTNIAGKLDLQQATTDSISINQLKLQNISNSPSTSAGYCCASIKARILNA